MPTHVPSLQPGTIQMTTKTLKKHPCHSSPLLADGFFDIKELTLVSHIETLKRIANDESPAQNVNNSSNNTSLPVLFNVNSEHITHKNILNKAASNTWAIDPGSVAGNLRTNQTPKFGNLDIQDILSRGSSAGADKYKSNDDNDDRHPSDKNTNNKSRRRSTSKSAKKKSGKKKNGSSATPTSTKSISIFPKHGKELQSTSISLHDIDGLSAMCQGVTMHEKANIKKSSEKTKLQNNNHNPSNQTRQSLASKSLSNAIVEYSKRHSSQPPPASHVRRKLSSSTDEAMLQTRKVYLSEKQSGIITDGESRYPCAPPATPSADQAKKYEYVPSLHDIRSQRSFRQRLQLMETKATKKEKKKSEENARLEQLSIRERKIEMKKRQRLEIYALNKIMTDLEHERFLSFMSSAGANI